MWAELRSELLEWLRWDLERLHLPGNNRTAYFGCLLILVCEELL